MVATVGSFGYKIGKKVRLMKVNQDANLMWRIAVRELYVLLRHYETVTALRQAFAEIKVVKEESKPPSPQVVARCAPFTHPEEEKDEETDWTSITHYCQQSFINVLEAGVFLNNGVKTGLLLLFDFNTETVRWYEVDDKGREYEYDRATVTEILEFADMPTKTYTEIVSEMKERYERYHQHVQQVDEEVRKIQLIIEKAMHEQNIIQKARALIDDMRWERIRLDREYRFFYHRLDALNLIDHSESDE